MLLTLFEFKASIIFCKQLPVKKNFSRTCKRCKRCKKRILRTLRTWTRTTSRTASASSEAEILPHECLLRHINHQCKLCENIIIDTLNLKVRQERKKNSTRNVERSAFEIAKEPLTQILKKLCILGLIQKAM